MRLSKEVRGVEEVGRGKEIEEGERERERERERELSHTAHDKSSSYHPLPTNSLTH